MPDLHHTIPISDPMHDRALGCLLGQACGDSLGSQVEFDPHHIIIELPRREREDLIHGGCWNTMAGQLTDDTELALELGRAILEKGYYSPIEALGGYVAWLRSEPFDCGNTISRALSAVVDQAHIGRRALGDTMKAATPDSQANGALMRVSPLGVFGALQDAQRVTDWAAQDARITHPHPVCVDANRVFTATIAHAIREGTDPQATAVFAAGCAQRLDAHPDVQTL